MKSARHENWVDILIIEPFYKERGTNLHDNDSECETDIETELYITNVVRRRYSNLKFMMKTIIQPYQSKPFGL